MATKSVDLKLVFSTKTGVPLRLSVWEHLSSPHELGAGHTQVFCAQRQRLFCSELTIKFSRQFIINLIFFFLLMRFTSIEPWCIQFIYLKCPPLCLNKNQCLPSLLVLPCNVPHVSHGLPSPGGAYRREHCAAARGSCRDYFRMRCAVIFFPLSSISCVSAQPYLS